MLGAAGMRCGKAGAGTDELRVPVDPGLVTEGDVERLVVRFHEAHRHMHGYDVPEAPVQIVNVRVALRVPPAPLPTPARTGGGRLTPIESRSVFFEEAGGRIPCPIYRRQDLATGIALRGPAIVEQMDSTVVVPPEVRATVHASGSLLLER